MIAISAQRKARSLHLCHTAKIGRINRHWLARWGNGIRFLCFMISNPTPQQSIRQLHGYLELLGLERRAIPPAPHWLDSLCSYMCSRVHLSPGGHDALSTPCLSSRNGTAAWLPSAGGLALLPIPASVMIRPPLPVVVHWEHVLYRNVVMKLNTPLPINRFSNVNESIYLGVS